MGYLIGLLILFMLVIERIQCLTERPQSFGAVLTFLKLGKQSIDSLIIEVHGLVVLFDGLQVGSYRTHVILL